MIRFFFHGDRIISTIFLIFTGLYFWQTLTMPKSMEVDVVGPASFPRLLVTCGAIFAIAQMVNSWRDRDKSDTLYEGKLSGFFSDLGPIYIVLGYIAILEPLGFLPATFIYFTITMLYFGSSILRALFYSTMSSIVIFSLFFFGLSAPLPNGRYIPIERVLETIGLM